MAPYHNPYKKTYIILGSVVGGVMLLGCAIGALSFYAQRRAAAEETTPLVK